MAKVINIGDEVAITATVRRRVTEDRVSVSIPSYGQPHFDCRRTTEVTKGQHIELIGNVTHLLDKNRVTVNLGIPVTVDAAVVRLVNAYKPPTRKKPVVDKPT